MAALFGTDNVGIQHHLTHTGHPCIANLPAPTNRRKNTADDGLVRNVVFEGVCESRARSTNWLKSRTASHVLLHQVPNRNSPGHTSSQRCITMLCALSLRIMCRVSRRPPRLFLKITVLVNIDFRPPNVCSRTPLAFLANRTNDSCFVYMTSMPAVKRNRVPNHVDWRSCKSSIGPPNAILVGLVPPCVNFVRQVVRDRSVPPIYPGQRSPLSKHLGTPVYEIRPTIFDPWFAQRIPGNCDPRLCFLHRRKRTRVTDTMSIGVRSMPLALTLYSLPAHRSFQAFLPNLVDGLQGLHTCYVNGNKRGRGKLQGGHPHAAAAG
ncbi:hypothetical protein BKA63DRAFT_2084 [Paraphoma chrysanthemicola]|nr:hypothetical protein BKA63DRAFT_2084 [Paraphoma chrysanthemicola]